MVKKMSRLIEADEIKKREKDVVLANGAKHRCFDTTMLSEIPPVDAVEVVRCKDCKWGDITDYGSGEVLECIRDRLYQVNSISLEGETYFRKVEPGDFCAWGERKEK